MKSSKTESAKYAQRNGAIPLGETGPLFPRLHVSETEKAGPRAPPRNKMALFEQFTVPSHRFMQPSRTTAISNQQQQFVPNDCQHPFGSRYMSSLTSYSILNSGAPSHSQPSHDITSCLTSSGSASNAEESQRASRPLTVETSVGVSRLTTKKHGRGLMEAKAKVASNDIIPMKDLQRAEAKDMQEVPNTMSVESIERPVITDNAQEALSIVLKVSTYPMVESQNCGDQKKAGCTEVIENVQLRRVALESSAEVLNEHNQGCLTSNCEQQVCIASSSGCSLTDNLQNTFMSQELSRPSHISKDTQEKWPSDGEKGDASATELSANSLLNKNVESMWESRNSKICSNETSELSRHGAGLQESSYGSSLSGLALQAIRPNDVIRAVGQQQFWKARKALLRQQHIFSDQVFELHKLIKVQQLLAAMPGTLLDEEMLFVAMNECAAAPSHCNIREREHGWGEKVCYKGSGFEETEESRTNGRGTQLEVIEKPECLQAVGNDGRGSKPYLPTFSHGGISAWGYPSLGMEQWMGPIPAQGRLSAYQPFAATFASGAPYCGPYGLAMLGSVSSMVPLGIPYGGPGNKMWEETSLNQGLTAGPNHQVVSTMFHTPSHMVNELSGAWHLMNLNNIYYNQRLYSSTPKKDAPTGSGAPTNNERPAKTIRQSDTNGIENGVHQQRENSIACAATGSNAAISMPSTFDYKKANSQHPARNLNENGVFQMLHFKHYEANRSRGKEEANIATPARWLKPEQSNRVPFNNGHSEDCTSDDALDLFSVVPSLTPNEQSGSKQEREHWQGRVIKAVPHPAVAASQSTAGILLSLQQERNH